MEDTPWTSTGALENISGLPDFGFRVGFSHEYKEPCKPFSCPRLLQIPGLMGMGIRYALAWWGYYRNGKKMFIDNFDLCPWRPIYGAPIGGIGCGTIGRGFKGEFCRFQMIPGMYKYNIVEADQFIVSVRKEGRCLYQSVLSPNKATSPGMKKWKWEFPKENATYHALYPRAWTVYDLPGQNIRLVCRQISPVFPHDYKDTSLPCAVFVWSIENNNDEPVDVSITFTFKNGQGEKSDREGGVHTEPFVYEGGEGEVNSGVMIHQEFRGTPCVYAVSAKHGEGVDVSHKTAFNPNEGDDTAKVWEDLQHEGCFCDGQESSDPTKQGEEISCAVCVACTVDGNGSKEVQFSLTWDMPIITFGGNETKWCRRYARYFGSNVDASPKLASYALNNYIEWEKKIDEWQTTILKNSQLPAWYKSALFNELYFVSDGGTVWVDPCVSSNGDTSKHAESVTNDKIPPIVSEYGKFAYLEGHEYRMYNTYDVHHYASFALIMLWPKLQLSIQYDIAEAICLEQPQQVKYCMSGEYDVSKACNSVPHDIGDPDDEPWKRVNAYIIHPTQEWKDLNTKFILQVYRDYKDTGDQQFLCAMYPKCQAVMNRSLNWDTDNDGIIDNGGFADQTYDAWTMLGASAYCGGMWLAAMKMFIEMSKELENSENVKKFNAILEKGRKSFEEKLWNGKYYDYDSSTSYHHDSVMSDQLAGQWFLKASDIPDNSVFPKDHVQSALEAVFEYNIKPFDNGTMGAINGMRPDGTKDYSSVQSEEFWTGVTYSVAALMMQEGMIDKGWQTAYGAYHVCYERYGLAFQTPEAYMDDRHYRSLGYMRPLSIWAIQHAIQKNQPQLLRKRTGNLHENQRC